MKNLLVKGQQTGRDIVTVTPESAGWRYVGFAAKRIARGERSRSTPARRNCASSC